VIIDKVLNSKYVNIYGVDGVVEIVHDKVVTEECGAMESDRLWDARADRVRRKIIEFNE
jgi:hypothetical protein